MQTGGQSLNGYDYAMAEGVRKSFKKTLLKEITNALKYTQNNRTNQNEELSKKIQWDKCRYTSDRNNEVTNYIADVISIPNDLAKQIYDITCTEVENETYQAMEAFIFNLNTLNSRSGAQWVRHAVMYGQ